MPNVELRRRSALFAGHGVRDRRMRRSVLQLRCERYVRLHTTALLTTWFTCRVVARDARALRLPCAKMPRYSMTGTENPRLDAAGRSDTGLVRNANEDRLLIAPDLGLFLVADGMGGHATGNVASAMVATSMHNFFRATRRQWMPPAAPEDAGLPPACSRLVYAVRKANRDLVEASAGHPEHKGMGSTIVALHVDDAGATLAHVGDSRCYRLRHGVITQLTNDHSIVGEALRIDPNLTAAELAMLPKNMITRALGQRPIVQVDAQRIELEEGDVLLLCSDGLHGEIDDRAIAEATLRHDDLGRASELLVTLAKAAGGHDNVSVVLVRVGSGGGGATSVEVTVCCTGCGAPVVEGNAFCTHCGTRT